MKKLGFIFKETQGSLIRNNIKESGIFLVVKYSGLSSPDLTILRQTLKKARANMFVVKNTVARRALKEAGFEGIIKSIEGPCGLIFVQDEPVSASKVLYNFAKDHEPLKLEGGVINSRIIDRKEIETLAMLPSKEVLRAQVVMGD
ncbi:MAG: 50S ribosomal protein L10 [Candidatus Omnitrophica bacterium]|nr:50S ribosomal protein L10 [Candidatus Omnitrophota bacterium]